MGTLIALDPPAPRLRGLLSERFGLELSEPEAKRALAAEIAYYRANMHRGSDAQRLQTLRADCAAVLGAALPGGDRLAASDLTEVLLAALEFSPYPDAAPALEAARRRGQKLVVVSNWDCSLPGVLERTGLTPWLDGIITSAEVGAAKPSPLIFRRALELAGVEAGEAVHVGDSIIEDVEGARAAGLTGVLLAREGVPVPDGVVSIISLAALHRVTAPQPARPV